MDSRTQEIIGISTARIRIKCSSEKIPKPKSGGDDNDDLAPTAPFRELSSIELSRKIITDDFNYFRRLKLPD